MFKPKMINKIIFYVQFFMFKPKMDYKTEFNRIRKLLEEVN